MSDRLTAQLAFLDEIDRLKSVQRATPLGDNSRKENSGEHSWHIALYALVLADQAEPGVQIDRAIQMLLLHDIVEIDAGDAPIHASFDAQLQANKEQAAAERIFGLLPADQGAAFRALWDEFEAAQTPTAIYAKSLDRLQPMMQNLASGGGSWIDYNVTFDQTERRAGLKVARGLPAVWHLVGRRVADWFNRNTAT